MVKDISDGSGGSFPYYLTMLGNILYFTAKDGTNEPELWKSDGTSSGTVLVKDNNSGSGDSSPYYLWPLGTLSISEPTTESTGPNCGRAMEGLLRAR